MTYKEHLIARAENFWAVDAQPPFHLVAQMVNEGIDVDAVEKQFKLLKQYDN